MLVSWGPTCVDRRMTRYDIDSIDNRDPDAIERFATRLQPIIERWFHPVVRGLDRIPGGKCLYVGNHSGGLMTPDTFVWGLAAYRRYGLEALPYGLAHEVALRFSIVQRAIVPLGAVRAGHDTAHRLFAAGKKVLVYPGSDYDSFRSYARRDQVVFGPRRGYLRLALREAVPIVPVVAAGSHETLLVLHDGRVLSRVLRFDKLLRAKVAPVMLSVPWGLSVGLPLPTIPWPSPIWVEVLEPIGFERHGPDAAEDAAYVERCHERVLSTMNRALASLAAERRRATKR